MTAPRRDSDHVRLLKGKASEERVGDGRCNVMLEERDDVMPNEVRTRAQPGSGRGACVGCAVLLQVWRNWPLNFLTARALANAYLFFELDLLPELILTFMTKIVENFAREKA